MAGMFGGTSKRVKGVAPSLEMSRRSACCYFVCRELFDTQLLRSDTDESNESKGLVSPP